MSLHVSIIRSQLRGKSQLLTSFYYYRCATRALRQLLPYLILMKEMVDILGLLMGQKHVSFSMLQHIIISIQ